MSTKPGLMFVPSPIYPDKTTDEEYNRFYNDEHLSDVLNHPEGSKVIKLAKRYKSTDPESKMPYLYLYTLQDHTFATSDALHSMSKDTLMSKTYGNKPFTDFLEFGMKPYEKIQTYEGLHHSKPEPTTPDPSKHAQTLVCIAMEPAEGQDQDFDDWYRKQHLDMMAMLPHYRRTTRYKRSDGEKPRYLALHEWDCRPDELTKDRSLVVGTEWSKKILD